MGLKKFPLLLGLISLPLFGWGKEISQEINLDKGLIAFWSFDNCTVKDFSGHHNNGVIHGNLKCVKGIKGHAFEFDGNSWIDIGKTQILSEALESQNFSIFLCFKAYKVSR